MKNLEDSKRVFIEELVNALAKIDGVSAIVLAGSYARGTNHKDSELFQSLDILYELYTQTLNLTHA